MTALAVEAGASHALVNSTCSTTLSPMEATSDRSGLAVSSWCKSSTSFAMTSPSSGPNAALWTSIDAKISRGVALTKTSKWVQQVHYPTGRQGAWSTKRPEFQLSKRIRQMNGFFNRGDSKLKQNNMQFPLSLDASRIDNLLMSYSAALGFFDSISEEPLATSGVCLSKTTTKWRWLSRTLQDQSAWRVKVAF